MPVIPIIPFVNPDPELMLMVDLKLKQPAGVFVQLADGCSVELLDLFDEAAILHIITPDIQVMRGTRSQWALFAAQTNQRIKEQS